MKILNYVTIPNLILLIYTNNYGVTLQRSVTETRRNVSECHLRLPAGSTCVKLAHRLANQLQTNTNIL